MYTNEYIAMQLQKARESELKDMRHYGNYNRAVREAIDEQKLEIKRGRKNRSR